MGVKDELSKLRKSLDKMAEELHETNKAIRESLKLTSDTIREMSENFSKTLEESLIIMRDMKIQMDIKDTIFKTLGIDSFLKRKK
ncbi:MAG: hypothetical protein WBH31_11100 [Promethearchaeia archaeon]